jgi:hypothetical protein
MGLQPANYVRDQIAHRMQGTTSMRSTALQNKISNFDFHGLWVYYHANSGDTVLCTPCTAHSTLLNSFCGLHKLVLPLESAPGPTGDSTGHRAAQTHDHKGKGWTCTLVFLFHQQYSGCTQEESHPGLPPTQPGDTGTCSSVIAQVEKGSSCGDHMSRNLERNKRCQGIS